MFTRAGAAAAAAAPTGKRGAVKPTSVTAMVAGATLALKARTGGALVDDAAAAASALDSALAFKQRQLYGARVKRLAR